MTHKVLADVFMTHGECKRDGKTLSVPHGIRATLFVAVGNESLVVERLAALGLEDDVLIAKTERGELYVLAYEDIRAIRFHSSAQATGY